MSNTWDDICKSVSGFAKKTGRKIEYLSDTAAIRLKISARKADLEEAYIALGQTVYGQSLEKEPDAPFDVETHLGIIAALQAEIAELQQRIADKKNTDQ